MSEFKHTSQSVLCACSVCSPRVAELDKLVQTMFDKNKELETSLYHLEVKAKAAEEKARLSHEAWYVQREATGKAWWDGAKWGHTIGLKGGFAYGIGEPNMGTKYNVITSTTENITTITITENETCQSKT